MAIEIRAERIWDKQSGEYYKITGLSALTWEDLPEEYTDGNPHIFMSTFSSGENYLRVRPEGENETLLKVGNMVSKRKFENLLAIITAAGGRLQTINRQLAERKAAWHGEIEYRI